MLWFPLSSATNPRPPGCSVMSIGWGCVVSKGKKCIRRFCFYLPKFKVRMELLGTVQSSSKEDPDRSLSCPLLTNLRTPTSPPVSLLAFPLRPSLLWSLPLLTPCIILLGWPPFLSSPAVRALPFFSLTRPERQSPELSLFFFTAQIEKVRGGFLCMFRNVCKCLYEFHEHTVWEGGWVWLCGSGPVFKIYKHVCR